MRKLWLLCSSILLATMYFFTFTNFSSQVRSIEVSSLSAEHNAIIEVGTQVKKSEEKREVRYRHTHVLLPLLPFVTLVCITYTVIRNPFRVIHRLFYNSAQVPALGANAPPVYMY